MSLALLVCTLLATADARILAENAAALAEKGHLAESLTILKQAALIAPQDATIAYDLAQLHEALGDSASAIREYERYLTLNPDAQDADALRGWLGEIADLAELPDAARKKLERGNALVKQKRFEEAEREYLQAVELAPDYAAPLFNLALVLDYRGERDRAKTFFQRFARIASPLERARLEAHLSRAPAAEPRESKPRGPKGPLAKKESEIAAERDRQMRRVRYQQEHAVWVEKTKERESTATIGRNLTIFGITLGIGGAIGLIISPSIPGGGDRQTVQAVSVLGLGVAVPLLISGLIVNANVPPALPEPTIALSPGVSSEGPTVALALRF